MRSPDRSSPRHREDTRRHPGWRTHLAGHGELQRPADCPRGGRHGNRCDQNHVALAMESAEKRVSKLFLTKMTILPKAPKPQEPAKRHRRSQRGSDYVQGCNPIGKTVSASHSK